VSKIKNGERGLSIEKTRLSEFDADVNTTLKL
jgi:hypothetical protein